MRSVTLRAGPLTLAQHTYGDGREVAEVNFNSTLLTAEEDSMVRSLDSLCSRVITDKYLDSLDTTSSFPEDALRALASAEWASLCVPSKYGGEEAPASTLCLLLETVARHSLAVAQAIYSLWIMGSEAMARLGSDEQRAHWLPEVARGHARIAIALTEPGSGSDAAGLRTQATRDGDDFVVRGQKVFITGASVADVIITAVRTASGTRKQEGISCLLIEPDRPGVSIRRLSKMGLKALDLCEVFLDDVRIPIANALGELNSGWEDLREGLAKERLFLAAICVGALRDVLERSLSYAQERTAFGKPIASHQMVADKLVAMRVSLENGRSLVQQAARLVETGHPDASSTAAIAKLVASGAYVSACREGVQIFGGYGFTDECRISRHYRDCKYLEIGGGTSEIQKIVIARSMGIRL